jgi:hypothetical protein
MMDEKRDWRRILHKDILVERYLTFKMTDVALVGTNERRPHSVPVAYRAA